MVERGDIELVEVNLRSAPWYWWSTRLYLLAAVAEEYTSIQRLIFVEQYAARLYIGMASPAAVRKALAARMPDRESAFRRLQEKARRDGASSGRQQVESILQQWQYFSVEPQDQYDEAKDPKVVTPDLLREWLSTALETESRKWHGAPPTPRLYAQILSCRGAYVPLLQRRRLEVVTNRCALAARIAEAAVSRRLTS